MQNDVESGRVDDSDATRVENPSVEKQDPAWDWDTDPENPLNWTPRTKLLQVMMVSASAFTAFQLQQEFNVTVTQSILPLSMYVFALGLGPVVGGPLSETVGRLPVYLASPPLGALFTLGAALTHNFGALCFLRFMAGFTFSPSLAVGSGTVNDIYHPIHRGVPASLYILMPFLGPGFGPVIGSFVTSRKGWRWTQWTLCFFAIFAFLLALAARETHHPIIKRRLAKKKGLTPPPAIPLRRRLGMFLTIALVRPLKMLVSEPIVTFTCLYSSCMFATLFSFFASIPYVFTSVFNFTLEQQGLVFISIIVGCVLGTITIILCNVFLYLPQTKKHPPHQTPPEHRLYPAMLGSIGLPISLFWFAWTARGGVSWVSPAVAVMPFAWGNICLFTSVMQYLGDTYLGTTVASAASANSFSRYVFAGAFPLFTIQMYQRLGTGWACSLLGFIALALMPVPWVIFKWGKAIRAKSRFETAM